MVLLILEVSYVDNHAHMCQDRCYGIGLAFCDTTSRPGANCDGFDYSSARPSFCCCGCCNGICVTVFMHATIVILLSVLVVIVV
jgi:hypothetical protein